MKNQRPSGLWSVKYSYTDVFGSRRNDGRLWVIAASVASASSKALSKIRTFDVRKTSVRAVKYKGTIDVF